MGDTDEDVVISGSALHKHLVQSGFSDVEISRAQNNTDELSLAHELNGACGELTKNVNNSSMKK